MLPGPPLRRPGAFSHPPPPPPTARRRPLLRLDAPTFLVFARVRPYRPPPMPAVSCSDTARHSVDNQTPFSSANFVLQSSPRHRAHYFPRSPLPERPTSTFHPAADDTGCSLTGRVNSRTRPVMAVPLTSRAAFHAVFFTLPLFCLFFVRLVQP